MKKSTGRKRRENMCHLGIVSEVPSKLTPKAETLKGKHERLNHCQELREGVKMGTAPPKVSSSNYTKSLNPGESAEQRGAQS